MFYLLALTATLGYALQGALMASYYRRIDPIAAVAYRGLSLGITMLPLLWFTRVEHHYAVFERFPALAIAIWGAVLGNWLLALGYRHLTVGVNSAAHQSIAVVTVTILGFSFFNESLSWQQLFWMALILSANGFLGLLRSPSAVKETANPLKGYVCSCLAGFTLAFAFSAIGYLSRETHPFAAGYYWELLIGVAAYIVLLLRGLFKPSTESRVSARDLVRITLYSSPTAIGTGCYALATTMGPIAIATAIASSVIVTASILGFLFYGERLSYRQVVLIVVAWLAIVGLKLSE